MSAARISPPLASSELPRTSLLFALLALNGFAGPAVLAQEVRDSAGVQIVRSSAPVWKTSGGWQVDSRPSVVIGTVVGEANQELGRVVDAMRLADGRILVADDRQRRLLLFSPRGRFLGAAGGEGQGPGEFESLTGVASYRGDSVVVYDFSLLRLSILDADATFRRSIRLAMFPPRLIGAFADGTFSVRVDSLPRPWAGTWAWGRYYRLGPEGSVMDTLGPFRRFQVHPVVLPDGHATVATTPFRPELMARIHDDRLYIADSGQSLVNVFTPDGEWIQSVRFPSHARPVTQADRDAVERDRLGATADPNRRRWVSRMLEETPFPDRTAAFETFLVDSRGNLWLEPYPEPAAKSVPWQVIAASGQWLGSVHVPSDLTVYQVGDDFLLGRREADYGIHQVVLHGLKPGPGEPER